MKTLLLSPELFRAEGGIARIMRLYLRALCEGGSPGDEVRSLALNDLAAPDPRLASYSTPVLKEAIGCGGQKGVFVRRALQLARRSDRAICGHLHQLSVLWLARRFKRRLQYILVAHGIEVWRPYSWLETRALCGAHRILCVSEYTRQQLLRFCPALQPNRLVVVPNTLDPQLQSGAAAGPTPPRLDGPRLLAVSRLSGADSYKGIDTLIEALPHIRRRHPLAHLRVVGTGDDEARLQSLARELRVSGSVEFVGRVSDDALRAEYAACDFFALPSRKEGFGLVFLEAMTHGKPCLGARAAGAPEVINDRVGALAEYGNIPDIAAAVTDLVRYPRDPGAVRQHAASFDFASFQQRLGAALN